MTKKIKLKLSSQQARQLKINIKDKKYKLFLNEVNRLLNLEIEKGKIKI